MTYLTQPDYQWKSLEWLSSNDQINGDELADRLTFLEDTLIDEDASDRLGVDMFVDEAAPEEVVELRELREIIEEITGYSGERIGDIVLIAEGHFPDYAREFAENINGDLYNAPWPLTHIDWKSAADELRTDYTVITIRGKDFWYR